MIRWAKGLHMPAFTKTMGWLREEKTHDEGL